MEIFCDIVLFSNCLIYDVFLKRKGFKIGRTISKTFTVLPYTIMVQEYLVSIIPSLRYRITYRSTWKKNEYFPFSGLSEFMNPSEQMNYVTLLILTQYIYCEILNNETFVVELFGIFPLITWKVFTNVSAALRLPSSGSWSSPSQWFGSTKIPYIEKLHSAKMQSIVGPDTISDLGLSTDILDCNPVTGGYSFL